MDAVQLDRHLDLRSCDTARPAVLHADKWVLLRELGVARKRFGITDRQLVVLQALLALRKGAELCLDDPAGLIVHPSNATLSTRLNGMPVSTLRRHLAHLVDAGLIARRDSPNGKRYVRRYRDGKRDVFGFDLSPLVHRATEIFQAAEDVRTEEEEIARLRQTISLMRRDLAGLIELGREHDPSNCLWTAMDDLLTDLRPLLRRKPDVGTLATVIDRLEEALAVVNQVGKTAIMSTTDRQTERHYQSSDKEIPVSEERQEIVRITSGREGDDLGEVRDRRGATPDLTLEMMRQACPEIVSYSQDGIQDWRNLCNAARTIVPMIGISESAWFSAVQTMGLMTASIAVAGILQRLSKIRSPGGYLRTLTLKAVEGSFNCVPMIHALARTPAQTSQL